MSNIAHRTSLDAAPQRVAPKEIQLWNAGDNPTDYGVHIWNQRSIDTAYADYKMRGNLLGIDVEHNKSTKAIAEAKTDEPQRMAGYCSLEIRDGAPWLCFQWSDYGRQQIESGERRYLSPEYYTDPDTREIISIVRISLVAEPGTWNARQLCAKASDSTGIIPTNPSRLPKAAARTKAARMNEQDLAMAGAVMLALMAILQGASDEGLKQWAQGVHDQMMEKLGDQAQTAMELAKQMAPASQEAPAAAEMPADEKDKEKVAAEKRIASLEEAVKTLTSKLDTIGSKAAAVKPWVAASAPTRAPAPETTYGLTAEEYARCKAKGLDPQKFAASKARIVR